MTKILDKSNRIVLCSSRSRTRKSWLPFAIVSLCALGTAACGDNSDGTDEDSGETNDNLTELRFWRDVAPIYYDRCVSCHQPGGGAPFSLADYANAKAFAVPSKLAVQAKTMPPWLLTDDGTCGSFRGSMALRPDEIDTISTWVDQGAVEGTPVEMNLPVVPGLPGTTDYATPLFVPEIEGGDLAKFDEYRCFAIDPQLLTDKFITGFSIQPGNPALVHHAVVFNLDPNLEVEGGKTNLEVIQALDADSPERLGWPCFGATGEGTEPSGVPITWAPGQGPLEYPQGTGARVSSTDLLVVQMHYNMTDTTLIGQSDTTQVKIRWADEVEHEGFFILPDPLLDSLFGGEPDVLPPGLASYPYVWERTPAQLGLEGVAEMDIYGIFPHMHTLGKKFNLSMRRGEENVCAADVQNWDFNWHRMYFYDQPIRIGEHDPIRVTCDYDTSHLTEETYPGWGTQNEMCLALMFIVPVL